MFWVNFCNFHTEIVPFSFGKFWSCTRPFVKKKCILLMISNSILSGSTSPKRYRRASTPISKLSLKSGLLQISSTIFVTRMMLSSMQKLTFIPGLIFTFFLRNKENLFRLNQVILPTSSKVNNKRIKVPLIWPLLYIFFWLLKMYISPIYIFIISYLSNHSRFKNQKSEILTIHFVVREMMIVTMLNFVLSLHLKYIPLYNTLTNLFISLIDTDQRGYVHTYTTWIGHFLNIRFINHATFQNLHSVNKKSADFQFILDANSIWIIPTLTLRTPILAPLANLGNFTNQSKFNLWILRTTLTLHFI